MALPVINSMGLSHWEAASRSAMQESPNTLWNVKVEYRVHKESSILNEMNSVHTTIKYESQLSS
jgi:hypothetical protein